MQTPLSIPADKTLPHSQDFSFLRKKGIESLQQYSGEIWSDYNDHDPGVTLLEQICFTLTDLGYRTGFPIEDLLRAGPDKQEDTFFPPEDILPSHPITLNDYRKLLIDKARGVKNAWITPLLRDTQGIAGIYEVLLQLEEDKYDLDECIEEVRAILNAHRNLGEDFDKIEVLKNEKIQLSVDITLKANALGESVLGKMIAKIEDYLSPPVRRFSLDELLKEGYELSEILDGPLPENGFIKNEDLKSLRNEVRISEIVEIISSLEGVSAIHHFQLKNKNGRTISGDTFVLEGNKIAELENYLDPSNRDSIRFFRGNTSYHIDFNTANQIYATNTSRYKTSYLSKKVHSHSRRNTDFSQNSITGISNHLIQTETLRGVETYYPLQTGLPKIYGVGEYGVPKMKNTEANARQLKGYLMVFEQLLANYLSQLSNVASLFSIENKVDKTYFSQPPLGVPKIETVIFNHKKNAWREFIKPKFDILKTRLISVGLKPSRHENFDWFFERFVKDIEERNSKNPNNKGLGFETGLNQLLDRIFTLAKRQKKVALIAPDLREFKKQAIREGFRANLSALMEEMDPFPERRNRFLDHLLARFSETFPGAEASRSPNTSESFWSSKSKLEKITGKIHLLKNYVTLSRDRSKGYNYLHFSDQHNNVPELKKKISIFLNFMDADEGKLTSHRKFTSFLGHAKISEGPTETPSPELPESTGENQETEIQETPARRFTFKSPAPHIFRKLLAEGTRMSSYRILRARNPETVYRVFFRNHIDPVLETATKNEAEASLEKLVQFLKKVNQESEGFHLIEHILLRPIDSAKHKFDLLDERYTKFLTSYGTFEIDEKDEENKRKKQHELVEKLRSTGSKTENYSIEKQKKSGHYLVVLKDAEGNKFATSSHEFADKNKKDVEIESIVEKIKSLNQNNLLDARLQITERDIRGQEGSFYSYQCSLILPAWPSRFQREEFRRYLQNLVHVSAPAHLTINFHWLEIPDMITFESIYEDWLQLKEKPIPQQPALDNLSVLIADLLQTYKANKT